MAKYNYKLYAKALVDLVTERSAPAQMKKNVAGFLALLQKNGDLRSADKIIALAENLIYKKTGQRKIILEIARNLKDKSNFKDFLQEGDVIVEIIKPTLIAGINIVVNNEKQLDFSLKNKLDNIFN